MQLQRILYPLSKSIRMWDIPHAIKLLGLEPLLTELSCDASSADPADADNLAREIRGQRADAVMTHDFSPYAARACDECGIPYIAWIWDAPQDVLYDESIRLPHSFIFDFDRRQAEETAARGASFVRHMPLAGNVYRMEQLEFTETDEQRFTCDVSFIGSLYGSSDQKFATEQLSEHTRKELAEVADGQIGRWDGRDRVTNRFSEAAVEEIAHTLTEHPYIRSVMGERAYIEQVKLARHITHLERLKMLQRLGSRGIRHYLWDRERSTAPQIAGVELAGQLDYVTELPKACFLSGININLTLPSIRSGVPLRVYEIMAAGGFVLTNYQPELEELFRIGQEIEVFRSLEELEDKVDYYLKHEEERLRITLNGHMRVRDEHSYERRVAEMLQIVSAQCA